MGGRLVSRTGKQKRQPYTLCDEHATELEASGIDRFKARAAGIYTENDPARIERMLNHHPGRNGELGPGLVFPHWNDVGKATAACCIKFLYPRKNKGKPIKYEAPKGVPLKAYRPKSVIKVLQDATQDLIVTEGPKKAESAAQHGLNAIGILGIYGWQQRRQMNEDGKRAGPRELISDIAKIVWKGRTVYLVFDWDANEQTRQRVAEAAYHFSVVLRKAGAKVLIVHLPPGSDDEDGDPTKQGLDDYLVAHGVKAFRKLMAEATAPVLGGGTKGRRFPPCERGSNRSMPEKRTPGAFWKTAVGLGSPTVGLLAYAWRRRKGTA
jgi:hypothetical protein